MSRFPKDCWEKECSHFHVTDMADCLHCKHAIMDYEEYYGTTIKEWFVTGCEKCRNGEGDCPEFEEWEVRDG